MMMWYAFLISVLALAVWFDLRRRVIPNWVTLPAVLIAFFVAWLTGGGAAFANHLWGAGIVGGVWFIFWQGGWMGGGDQKLMLAVGAILGRDFSFPLIVCVAMAGGLQAAAAIARRRFSPRLSAAPAQNWRGLTLPYSLAIAAGSGAAVIFHYFGLAPRVF